MSIFDTLSPRSGAPRESFSRWLRQAHEVADDLAATAVEWDPDATADGGYRSWLVVSRGAVRVVVNLADSETVVPVAGAGVLGVLAAWKPATVDGETVRLPAKSVAVLGSGGRHGAV